MAKGKPDYMKTKAFLLSRNKDKPKSISAIQNSYIKKKVSLPTLETLEKAKRDNSTE